MAEQTANDGLEKGRIEDYSYHGDGSIHPNNRPEPRNLKHGLSATLRFITFGSTLAAFVVMVTNKQTARVSAFSLRNLYELTTHFHDVSAFVWFAIASAIVFVYSLLTLVVGGCLSFKQSAHSTYLMWVLFVMDLMMMNILMSACASTLAIELIGQNGNSHTEWRQFCNDFNEFCNHVTGALVAGAIGFAGLAELCILDAYHLSTEYTRY